MTTTNGKANGHDRPPFAEPIREQGPDNYLALRERIERQKAAEPVRTVEGKPLLTAEEEREAHRFGKVTGIGFGAAKELLQETKARRVAGTPLCGECGDGSGVVPDHRHGGVRSCGLCSPNVIPAKVAQALAGRPADATLPAGTAPTKPFPMPGTSWRWLGDKASEPHPHGPKTVASLRWFCGRVEAMFDDGESCAGVEHLMTCAAWECVPPQPSVVAPSEVAPPEVLASRLISSLCENDGDRGPRYDMARARFMNAAADLPGGWIPVATWILQRLPTLRETVLAIKLANCEPATMADGVTPTPNTYTPTTREEMALASLWRAVLDVSRLIDPHRDVRRGGAR